MAKLSKEDWEKARLRWERSSKDGFEWLAKELGIARPTVSDRAKREKWTKKTTDNSEKATVKATQKTTVALNVENGDIEVKKAHTGNGRPPGVPNKLTRVMKEYAAQFGDEVIDFFVSVLRGNEEFGETPKISERIQAGREILDRGYGRPAQAVEVTGDITTTVTEKELEPIYHNGIDKMNQQKIEREKELRRLDS